MDDENDAVVAVSSLVKTDSEPKELAPRPIEAVAAEAAKVLDLLATHLQLESPHPQTAKRVRGARTIPRDFVLSMIASAEARPNYWSLARFDTERARRVLEDGDAYRVFAERAAMFLASLNYTIEARWAEVAHDALRAFSLSSLVANDPEEAELAAEVENLRRKLGARGRPKKMKVKAEKGKV